MANPEYSPLVENLEDRFESFRVRGFKTMFVFMDGWGTGTSCEGVMPGQYDWSVYDAARAERPHDNATLLLALDLRQPFASQFPEHFAQLETWDALTQTPHVCISDRTGVNPARARSAFERTALAPSLSVVKSAGSASELAPAPKRDRSHLSLVPG